MTLSRAFFQVQLVNLPSSRKTRTGLRKLFATRRLVIACPLVLKAFGRRISSLVLRMKVAGSGRPLNSTSTTLKARLVYVLVFFLRQSRMRDQLATKKVI